MLKPIEKAKKNMTFPPPGSYVKTVPKYNDKQFKVFTSNRKYREARRKGKGVYIGFVPGSGGDLWYVRHKRETAIYTCEEVFDAY